MDTRNKPEPHQRYRHFKGDTYRIICLATDVQTGFECVVYQSESSEQIYVRSLIEFMSSVPNHKYRFEQI